MARKDIEQCSLEALSSKILGQSHADITDLKLASNPQFKEEDVFFLVTSEDAEDLKLKTEFEE